MVALRNPIRLPLSRVVPLPADFAHRSRLHGQAHVARVMVHAFLLLDEAGPATAAVARRLWASVYIHDLARTHDGRCARHGRDAAALLTSRPDLRERLKEGGVREEDLEAIRTAVTLHSHGEIGLDEPHGRLTGLLKDADGLDRVRLFDLDPSYFRLGVTESLVPFAQALYDATDGTVETGPGHFAEVFAAAERLLSTDFRNSPPESL